MPNAETKMEQKGATQGDAVLRADFLFEPAHNPLKSLEFGKINASKR